MPGAVFVCDDLTVSVGKAKATLSPSQAFGLAEDLIRAAARAIVVEEADRAAALDAVGRADPAGR
jgi:hypothetical protein